MVVITQVRSPSSTITTFHRTGGRHLSTHEESSPLSYYGQCCQIGPIFAGPDLFALRGPENGPEINENVRISEWRFESLGFAMKIYAIVGFPPGKVFEAQVKPKLQPQMAKLSPIAKLSWALGPAQSLPNWDQLYFPFHPSQHRTPTVVVDSKLQLSQASSSSHKWLSKQPLLVGS